MVTDSVREVGETVETRDELEEEEEVGISFE